VITSWHRGRDVLIAYGGLSPDMEEGGNDFEL
jgi:hypothetical protein